LFLSGGGREEAVKKVIEAVLSNQVVLQLQIAIKQKVNPAHGVPMAGAINALKVAASPHLYPAAAAQAPVSAAASGAVPPTPHLRQRHQPHPRRHQAEPLLDKF
jgi:hypothetical protein